MAKRDTKHPGTAGTKKSPPVVPAGVIKTAYGPVRYLGGAPNSRLRFASEVDYLRWMLSWKDAVNDAQKWALRLPKYMARVKISHLEQALERLPERRGKQTSKARDVLKKKKADGDRELRDEIVSLHRLEGLSNSKIALRLGISRRRVAALLAD